MIYKILFKFKVHYKCSKHIFALHISSILVYDRAYKIRFFPQLNLPPFAAYFTFQ